MDPARARVARGNRPTVSRAASRRAVEAVWRIDSARLVGSLARSLGDFSLAEDAAQDVFVRAYRNLAAYRPKNNAKFSTWLFQLARNAAIDRLRYRQRHPTEILDGVHAVVDRRVELNEIEKQISAAVAELPEKLRTALVLSEYENLSHAEIATIMKRSIKAVEVYIYRAKRELQNKIKV